MAAEEHYTSPPHPHDNDEIPIPRTTVPSPDDTTTPNSDVEKQQQEEEEAEKVGGGGGGEEEEEGKSEEKKEDVEEDRDAKRRRTCRGEEDIAAAVGGGFSFSFDTTPLGSPIGTTPKFGSFASSQPNPSAIDAVDFGIRRESSEIGGEEENGRKGGEE